LGYTDRRRTQIEIAVALNYGLGSILSTVFRFDLPAKQPFGNASTFFYLWILTKRMTGFFFEPEWSM